MKPATHGTASPWLTASTKAQIANHPTTGDCSNRHTLHPPPSSRPWRNRAIDIPTLAGVHAYVTRTATELRRTMSMNHSGHRQQLHPVPWHRFEFRQHRAEGTAVQPYSDREYRVRKLPFACGIHGVFGHQDESHAGVGNDLRKLPRNRRCLVWGADGRPAEGTPHRNRLQGLSRHQQLQQRGSGGGRHRQTCRDHSIGEQVGHG